MGYARAKSLPSLIAGLTFASLYAYSGYLIQSNANYGAELATATSVLLLGAMGPKAFKTRKPVPVLMATLGTIGSSYYGLKEDGVKESEKRERHKPPDKPSVLPQWLSDDIFKYSKVLLFPKELEDIYVSENMGTEDSRRLTIGLVLTSVFYILAEVLVESLEIVRDLQASTHLFRLGLLFQSIFLAKTFQTEQEISSACPGLAHVSRVFCVAIKSLLTGYIETKSVCRVSTSFIYFVFIAALVGISHRFFEATLFQAFLLFIIFLRAISSPCGVYGSIFWAPSSFVFGLCILEMYRYERSTRLRFVKFKKLQWNLECIARESQNVYNILSLMLPKSIIPRLIKSEFQFSTVTNLFDDAFCIFIEFFNSDLKLYDVELAAFLVNETFRSFDRFLKKYKEFEKIKTISSKIVLFARPNPQKISTFCKKMTNMFQELFVGFSSLSEHEIKSLMSVGQHINMTDMDWSTFRRQIRIGVDRGRVVAGIVGEEKFCYDLYSNTVNTASRMQSYGGGNTCHCTRAVYDGLGEATREMWNSIGNVHVKGKGIMEVYSMTIQNESETKARTREPTNDVMPSFVDVLLNAANTEQNPYINNVSNDESVFSLGKKPKMRRNSKPATRRSLADIFSGEEHVEEASEAIPEETPHAGMPERPSKTSRDDGPVRKLSFKGTELDKSRTKSSFGSYFFNARPATDTGDALQRKNSKGTSGRSKSESLKLKSSALLSDSSRLENIHDGEESPAPDKAIKHSIAINPTLEPLGEPPMLDVKPKFDFLGTKLKNSSSISPLSGLRVSIIGHGNNLTNKLVSSIAIDILYSENAQDPKNPEANREGDDLEVFEDINDEVEDNPLMFYDKLREGLQKENVADLTNAALDSIRRDVNKHVDLWNLVFKDQRLEEEFSKSTGLESLCKCWTFALFEIILHTIYLCVIISFGFGRSNSNSGITITVLQAVAIGFVAMMAILLASYTFAIIKLRDSILNRIELDSKPSDASFTNRIWSLIRPVLDYITRDSCRFAIFLALRFGYMTLILRSVYANPFGDYYLADSGGGTAIILTFIALSSFFESFTVPFIIRTTWMFLLALTVSYQDFIARTEVDVMSILDTIVAFIIGTMVTYRRNLLSKTDFLLDHILLVNQQKKDEEMKLTARLLKALLPSRIIRHFIQNDVSRVIVVEKFSDLTVIHLDVKSFTVLSSAIAPDVLISILNTVYTEFDGICRRNTVEKILTVGDAYIASGIENLQSSNAADSARRCCHVALMWQKSISKFQEARLFAPLPGGIMQVRIGIHSGTGFGFVTGGLTMIKYELLGDAVDLAEKAQELATPGMVMGSQSLITLLDTLHQTVDASNIFGETDGGNIGNQKKIVSDSSSDEQIAVLGFSWAKAEGKLPNGDCIYALNSIG
ncbi:hypothetical protein HDU97_003239 [Phlyctochytrium planicorne]|nr:hypothetical protein HDU97_003239 [Phlyctochytrium planicorne]